MASGRRLKLLVVATFVILVLMLFYSRDTYRSRGAELDRFNAERKAAKAAAKGAAGTGDDDLENAKMQQRLKDAEAAAKKKANEKAPNPPAGAELPPKKKADDSGSKSDEDATPEEKKVLDEMDEILKRSPIIIFSKTYCPFSKRAKKLLLEEYKIVPPPFVVELDIRDDTSTFQDVLLKRTGRRTVPNILIQGTSIGGADDVGELEQEGKLVSKIKSLGGGRIMSMDRVSAAAKLQKK